MSDGKPCCPMCREAENHEPLDIIKLRMFPMQKVPVALLVCKECGTVFDPRYVKEREL